MCSTAVSASYLGDHCWAQQHIVAVSPGVGLGLRVL